MSLLDSIDGPADLARLDEDQLVRLAEEIRGFLVTSVSRTGGHLGPNLGVVELTIALHRVFRTPRDTIVYDTGHISYVHKLLTGRKDFSTLRQQGGLSGYPSRAESDSDVVENSHASTSLSWAEGIAQARRLTGQSRSRRTVAVIGDGALTGGMAWEALNNIAGDPELPLVIVVNDNERSYSRTIGGLSTHLASLRTAREYERLMSWGKETLNRTPVVGAPMFEALHGLKKGIKDVVAPQGLFEDLGLKYIGPVDGHDIVATETALHQAAGYGAPVIVHVLTKKGQGYEHARNHDEDRFHAVGIINPETGLPLETSGRSWTDCFSDAIEAIGGDRSDVVALTAAMMVPVGLRGFAEKYPDRVFDTGIAEQHAVTMAAGLAYGGLHPVVAVYATFLNRAFDQLLMDAALHKAGVTLILDRAGITGTDGASHNGMWDLSICSIVPGLQLSAPRDEVRLEEAVRRAVTVDDAPTVVRFPKGNPPAPIEAVRTLGDGLGRVDVLREPDGGGTVHGEGEGEGRGGAGGHVDELIVAVGSMVPTAMTVAERLTDAGRSVSVVDPVWSLPVSDTLIELTRRAGRVVVIEDNLVSGGIGSAVALAMQQAGVTTPVRQFGVPKEFLDHASRGQVLAQIGLTPDAIVAALA